MKSHKIRVWRTNYGRHQCRRWCLSKKHWKEAAQGHRCTLCNLACTIYLAWGANVTAHTADQCAQGDKKLEWALHQTMSYFSMVLLVTVVFWLPMTNYRSALYQQNDPVWFCFVEQNHLMNLKLSLYYIWFCKPGILNPCVSVWLQFILNNVYIYRLKRSTANIGAFNQWHDCQ